MAKVALGRGRPVDEIESIARGRVWTGSDALGIGLVDELGGLRDAIRIARSRAGLSADAPLSHPLHVRPLARLGRAKNTEDPRAAVQARGPGLFDVLSALSETLPGISETLPGISETLPGLSEIIASLGLADPAELRMPRITIS